MRMWLIPVLLLCLLAPAEAGPRPELTVFAAASLGDVLPQVAAAWEQTPGGCHVVFSTDASSRLARQLEQGAPADLYVSADEAWMDWVAEKQLIVPASRIVLLGNELVCVVNAADPLKIETPQALLQPKLQHLALAGEEVPAGKYAKAALEAAQVPPELWQRVVRGSNVRAALNYVATGEAEAGIVYRTDALAEPRVAVAFTFDLATYPAIIYPAAVLQDAPHPALAQQFLEFCASDAALKIFAAAGFRTPPSARPGTL